MTPVVTTLAQTINWVSLSKGLAANPITALIARFSTVNTIGYVAFSMPYYLSATFQYSRIIIHKVRTYRLLFQIDYFATTWDFYTYNCMNPTYYGTDSSTAATFTSTTLSTVNLGG